MTRSQLLRVLPCLWLLVFVICAAGPLSADVVLVADGQPRAPIVLSAKPTAAARQGADILADHVFQISGARLLVVTENQLLTMRHTGPYVLVGESEMAKRLGATSEGLGPGGVLIKTYPNALVLLGPDYKTPSDIYGTRNAVTKFLEDALGVRTLWPGESGKVVPKRKTIQVGDMDVRFTPLVRQRYIRWMSYHARVQNGLNRLGVPKDDYLNVYGDAGKTASRSSSYFGWHRLGGSLGLASGHAFGHMWKTYSKEHPDWFALQPNGSRDQSKLSPSRSRLCVSNRELIEAVAKEKIEYLKKNPKKKSVAVGPNDGGRATFCTCPKCEKLDAPEGRKIKLWDFTGKPRRYFDHVSLTDRYVYFWNGIAELVAKEFPDVWLTADGYSAYAAPPVKRKLHPNVAIRFVGISYLSDERRRGGRADWDAWARAAKKIYFRPNLLLASRREGFPVIYVHKLAEDIRYMAHHSMIGTDFDSCAHNWAGQGLNYYVLAKLLWDPDVDVDAMIDDYCASGFGPAAGDIRAYLMRIEALTDEQAAKATGLARLYTPKAVAELRGHLDAAAKKAAGQAAVLRRIKFLRYGLDFADIQAASYRLLTEKGDKPLTPELRKRANDLLTQKWTLARKIMYEEPYAVNVAYVYWGGEARFGKLGFSFPKPEIKPPLEMPGH